MTSSASSYTRRDLSIPSHGETLSCWLFTPTAPSPSGRYPGLVLAHGLGGIKEMRLDAYASFFASQGFLCLVFDYRHWGASTGEPRNLVEPALQLEDWDVALSWMERCEEVDPQRIGVFGTSFGGGNVIQVGARDAAANKGRVKAIVSQCPFTDGWASAFTPGFAVVPRLIFWSLLDTVWSTLTGRPVEVNLVGAPGETALMNAPDVVSGVERLLPEGLTAEHIRSTLPARFVLRLPLLCPGRSARAVKAPILFAVCGKDTVAPPGPTEKWAKTAPKGVVKYYDELGHFDIYVGEAFERVKQDYLAFYKEHLGA